MIFLGNVAMEPGLYGREMALATLWVEARGYLHKWLPEGAAEPILGVEASFSLLSLSFILLEL